jgi:CYTH domain-containing protein
MFEAERKFLLKKLPNDIENDYIDCFTINHFYSNDGIRYTRKKYSDGKIKYIKTTKIPTSLTYSNYEVEVILTFEEFLHTIQDLIASGEKLREIEKVRYTKHDDLGNLWEIDIFKNINLVLAEVEIMVDNIEDSKLVNKIEVPDFIKDVLIMEVSHLREFSNSNLAI